MVEGDTSEYCEGGMISVSSVLSTASSPLYTLTNRESCSVVRHRRICGSLDDGTITVNLTESPCINLLDVDLRVLRAQ